MIDRRSFLGRLAAAVLALPNARALLQPRKQLMSLTVFIRYQIDPFKLDAFAKYADEWSRIIPRCGGDLIGYFLPHEGTNDIAFALISFASLAAYESYRQRLRADHDGKANFEFAQSNRIIVREERTFLRGVPSTLQMHKE